MDDPLPEQIKSTKTDDNAFSFNIFFLLFVILIFSFLGYVYYNYESPLSVAGIQSQQEFDLFFFNEEENLKHLAVVIKNHDVVVLYGVKNTNEKVDIQCEQNENASSTEEYQFITKRISAFLPPHYNIVVSDQVFNKRYVIFYNTEKMKTISDGMVLYHGNEAKYSLCSDNNDEMGILKYNPYLVPFKTTTGNFSIIMSEVTRENRTTDMDALEYFYNKIYNSWTDEVELRNTIIMFTIPQCQYKTIEPELSLKHKKYLWLLSDEECDGQQFIMRDYSLPYYVADNEIYVESWGGQSLKISSIKMNFNLNKNGE